QGTLTTAQKSAALGAAETLEALMIFEVLQTRDTLGVITQILDDPFGLAPFVTRDSGYKYTLNTLDAAAAHLTAGGTAFPFTLPPGFGAAVAGTAFNTPSTYLLFNRALTAKVAAYYATSGGGAAAWTQSLTALGASFLNASASSRAALDVGV